MKHVLALLFLTFSLFPAPTLARSSDIQKDEAVQVRLISGLDGVGEETTIPLALDVELAPTWHTYWRSPGDAGLPPQLDWQNSLNDTANVESTTLLYPTPKRYTAYGLETIGYRDHVAFPIDAQLRQPGHALNADVTVTLLVCSSVCVPKNFTLKLTVPVGPATESAEAPLIKQFRDQVPTDAAQSGVVIQSIVNHGQDLTITITSRDPLIAPDIFVENTNDTSFTAPMVTLAPDQHSAELKIKPADGLPVIGMPLTLTITDGNNAMEEHVKIPDITVPPLTAPDPHLSLGIALLCAILGGFILNLMPCVLPVLSLKILSVVSHGGGTRHLVRYSFLMTAAGIFFSYLVLAIMTIILKWLGLSLGWGVQFQQPLFIILLVLLLTFFAATMWGLLDIPLPRFLADKLVGPYHPKLAGDFAAGAFATLLATPCTAPFLGTAIGFALASGATDILMIFCGLGFGMTLPYLAIAIFPRIATMFPKPGAWMVTLKHLLGWALALTALWLMWILAAQITAFFASLVGVCMLAILLVLAARRFSFLRPIIPYGVTLLIILSISIVVTGSHAPKAPLDLDQQWVAFDEKAIAMDIAQGKTVFVDVTADWCLTCKANKKFILSQQEISDRLFHSDVVAMQADWTNPSPRVTAFLQKYQRYGIPFNVVFGPGAPQGFVLPELLSSQAVTSALDRAAKPPQ